MISGKKLNIDIKLGKWERIERKRTYLLLSLFRGSVAIVTNVAKVSVMLTPCERKIQDQTSFDGKLEFSC